jgi:hypothetical protein
MVEVSKYPFCGKPIVKFLLFTVVYAHEDVPKEGNPVKLGTPPLSNEPLVSVCVVFTNLCTECRSSDSLFLVAEITYGFSKAN